MSISYNVFDLDISNGLHNFPISAGRNYLILLDAPFDANVRVKLNDNNADDIPIKKDFAIEMSGNTEIYISADPIPGAKIKIGQSSSAKDFHIITSASLHSIISNFGNDALAQLDKIINPYQLTGTIQGSSTYNTQTSLINIVLDCDKIILNLSRSSQGSSSAPIDNIKGRHGIYAFLNNKCIAGLEVNKVWNLNLKSDIVVESIRNATLQIVGICEGNSNSDVNRIAEDEVSYILQKYSLK